MFKIQWFWKIRSYSFYFTCCLSTSRGTTSRRACILYKWPRLHRAESMHKGWWASRSTLIILLNHPEIELGLMWPSPLCGWVNGTQAGGAYCLIHTAYKRQVQDQPRSPVPSWFSSVRSSCSHRGPWCLLGYVAMPDPLTSVWAAPCTSLCVRGSPECTPAKDNGAKENERTNEGDNYTSQDL